MIKYRVMLDIPPTMSLVEVKTYFSRVKAEEGFISVAHTLFGDKVSEVTVVPVTEVFDALDNGGRPVIQYLIHGCSGVFLAVEVVK